MKILYSTRLGEHKRQINLQVLWVVKVLELQVLELGT